MTDAPDQQPNLGVLLFIPLRFMEQAVLDELKAHGHDARLMPARYVRPYSKGQKNDFRDAEAIAEAVLLRPTMKFVASGL